MGSLFKTPKPPPPRPTVVMPDPEAPEVRKAGQDEMLRRRRASGRASTLLSGGEGAASGSYNRTTLGT